MSELNKKIKDDIKEAMKNKENEKRDALRMLSAAIKQYEVDTREEITDSTIESLIQKLIKQRNEAATQFKDAGRNELYEKEMFEANLLQQYLPKQLDDAELENIIKEIILEVGATSSKDMGKVMAAAKEKIGTRADGKRVSEVVKKVLSAL